MTAPQDWINIGPFTGPPGPPGPQGERPDPIALADSAGTLSLSVPSSTWYDLAQITFTLDEPALVLFQGYLTGTQTGAGSVHAHFRVNGAYYTWYRGESLAGALGRSGTIAVQLPAGQHTATLAYWTDATATTLTRRSISAFNMSAGGGVPVHQGLPAEPAALGLIGYGRYVDTYASRSAITFATAASLGVATATTEAGRIYRVRSFSPAGHKPTGSLIAMLCALTRGTGLANTQVNPTGTQLGGTFTHDGAQASHARPLWAEYTGPLPAGTAQYALRVWVGDGTYHTDSNQHGITTTIEDLGPE